MVPESNPLTTALVDVVEAPLTIKGAAWTTVPYAVVVPYSNDTLVSLPESLTIPFKRAPVSLRSVVATVVAKGGGGEATITMLVSGCALVAPATNRSPGCKLLESTATGAFKLPVVVVTP